MSGVLHAVHGWGEQDKGRRTIERYTPQFRKHMIPVQVLGHDWPARRICALVQRHRSTEREAERLAERLRPGDGLFAFSNGNNIAFRAAEIADVPLRVWAAVAPALPHTTTFPACVQEVLVLHNGGDHAVRTGRLWSWVNPLAWTRSWDSRWGSMGARGYAGDDDRVTNWAGRRELRHLGWFDPEPTEYWAPKVANWIANRLL